MKKVSVRVSYKDRAGYFHNLRHSVNCESISFALDLLEKIIEGIEAERKWTATQMSIHIT